MSKLNLAFYCTEESSIFESDHCPEPLGGALAATVLNDSQQSLAFALGGLQSFLGISTLKAAAKRNLALLTNPSNAFAVAPG